jgi:uncharacterized protein YndB with AHSA1/START domain
MAHDVTVVTDHRFKATREQVFDAWLDPETARKWLFTTEASEIVEVKIDAQPGGKFVFVDRRDSGEFKGDIRHVGEYVEISRPERLIFTFGVPQFDPGMTNVIVDFYAESYGCEVILSHQGVPHEWRLKTREGWTKLLGNLDRLLSAR